MDSSEMENAYFQLTFSGSSMWEQNIVVYNKYFDPTMI